MQKLFKISPLEWRSTSPGRYVAKRQGVTYLLILCANMGLYISAHPKKTKRLPVTSEDHGKQLAEADWLARISPALEEVRLPDITVAEKAAYSAWYILEDADREALAEACGLPMGVIVSALENILHGGIQAERCG